MTELSVPRTLARDAAETSIRSRLRLQVLPSLLHNRMALMGVVILLGLTIFALFPSYFAPHDPIKQSLPARFIPPFWMEEGTLEQPLGTDQLGRDMLSRIIFGARVSLAVGSIAVLLSGVAGVLLGLTSGFVGGIIDNIIMALTEIQLSIPYVLLAIAIIAILGPDLKNLVIVLALSAWTIYAKLVRAEVLSVREEDYVLAARATGCRMPRIIFRHVFPQLAGPLIVVATLEMARIILLESALSFLGLGVQSPQLSWGMMLNDGREYLNSAWWVSTFSGLAIMVAVLAVNSVGNWLEEVLDPTSGASQKSLG